MIFLKNDPTIKGLGTRPDYPVPFDPFLLNGGEKYFLHKKFGRIFLDQK